MGREAFEVLSSRLGVSTECFASPLNARWSRHCSGVPSLDAPFGSLGSFFDLDPTEGGFEANPPFVPEVGNLAEGEIWRCADAASRMCSL